MEIDKKTKQETIHMVLKMMDKALEEDEEVDLKGRISLFMADLNIICRCEKCITPFNLKGN